MKYTAILHEADEGGYWATCAELPEANGQGETEQDALTDLKQAIELVIDHNRRQGGAPEPTRLVPIDIADVA